jgi:predicted  nucleic acid-binding Zn-ribbon protein
MSRAEPLYRLQLLDLELDQARRRWREIEAALAGSPALAHTRAELAKAEQTLRQTTTELKSLELEAQSLDEKIAAEEDRLYSGRIRNPKEMLDVQQELEGLKRRRSALDEQILAMMEQAEQQRAALQHCREALAQAEQHFAEDSERLKAEQGRLRAKVEADLAQREALRRAIPAQDLATYEALRKKKPSGVAVALLKAGACSQCGTVPPSQLIQQANTGATLAFCPNCGRILYAR